MGNGIIGYDISPYEALIELKKIVGNNKKGIEIVDRLQEYIENKKENKGVFEFEPKPKSQLIMMAIQSAERHYNPEGEHFKEKVKERLKLYEEIFEDLK